MKKISLFAILLILPLFVNAASVSLSGTKTISPGETAALSIIVSDTDKIKGAQMSIDLSGSDFELLMSKATTSYMMAAKNDSALSVMVKDLSKSIPNKGTLAKIYVKAKSTATVGNTATITLKKVIFTTSPDGENVEDKNAANYSTTLTVGPVKSTNNYLSSLEITGQNISFDKKTTDYTLNVNEPGAALKVTAVAEDEKATVKVSSPTLVEGKNTITVTVTAESGAKRTYTIIVNVPVKPAANANDTKLKTLEVKGYNISFNPDKTEYLLNVENDVTTVEINSTLENEESSKTMDGPKELAVGENSYVITVTDKAGNKKEYRITINRKEAEKQCEVCKVCEECNPTDSIWKILAIALVIVTLAETIYMVTMRDKKQI